MRSSAWRALRFLLVAMALALAARASAQPAPDPLPAQLLELQHAGASVEGLVAAAGATRVAKALEQLCRSEDRIAAWALTQLLAVDGGRAVSLAAERLDAQQLAPAATVAAMEILGAAGALTAGPRLVQFTDRTFPLLVRIAAVDALGLLDGAASGTLQDLLGIDAEAQVRARAARALGLLAKPEYAAPLAAALDKDASMDVKVAAATALGLVGGETA